MDRLLEFFGNHTLLITGYLVVIVLLLQDFLENLFRRYQTTNPAGAVILMNREDTVVLDVREPGEYAKGHIQGALHIPYSKLDERAAELEPLRERQLLVVCQMGTRAGGVCKRLLKRGFTRVCALRGGMMAWEDQKLPVVKTGSRKK